MNGLVAVVFAFVCVATVVEPTPTEVLAPTPKEAEFRWQAKDMLKSLQMPSCATKGFQAPKGFHRTDLLKSEQQAVSEFEESAKGRPAQFHFAIAKADAGLELAKGENCWAEYNDLAFATIHLKMTQDQVRVSLARMQELAASLGEPQRANLPTASGAEFRALVRDLVRTSRPRCRLTIKAENEAVLATARAEVSRFRDRLAGSAYAAHFDIAEADIVYYDSISEVECTAPGSGSLAKVGREFLDSIKRQIAAVERKFPGR